MIAELTGAEGEWLLVALGVLGFMALLLHNVLGAIQKYKQLKNGSITPQPLPIVIEKSLTEKFVGMPYFEKFEGYVHKAHHDIKNEVHSVKLAATDRGERAEAAIIKTREEMEDLARELNKENERRCEKIHDRINAVAEEMPGKVLSLLKTTGHLRLPNGHDQ